LLTNALKILVKESIKDNFVLKIQIATFANVIVGSGFVGVTARRCNRSWSYDLQSMGDIVLPCKIDFII